MARAKKKAVAELGQPATEQPTLTAADFNPAEFDPAIKAAAIVQDVANSTHLPAEREAAHENGHSARFAPHRQDGQSHADAVGRRAGYSAAGMTDVVAGVRLREHQNPYLSTIKFDEKPSDEVKSKLKEHGFRWNQDNKEWIRPIEYETRVQDRILAERAFEEVAKMVRDERGIAHSYGGVA
ncbi:hypothetical protein J8F10_09245 [Gemmata sp. G18]|uniref:Uncharacterized protein n=1 Tax=Gemmata palustris TaxID=2822762 RepID=A0ABS5BP81_9BACT|nr:hypothetical protein [Gemmata palustris]MBP3955466.1 hypothetical protein [Gemmata palustris]